MNIPAKSSFALHILLLLQGVAQGIRITKLEIPKALAVGDSGLLVCEWDDEGDHVYTLKWYLGIDEFYRWTPLESPEVKTFPWHYFNVDTRVSHRGKVLLHNVTTAASGNYRCEVSGEAPTFKTSFSTAQMKVVDLPDSGPSINSMMREPLNLNQMVALTCISRNAKPPPSLKFYINNQPVQSEWKVTEYVERNTSTGLETAVKTLRFRLHPSLIPKGRLEVKCVASYPDLYWQSGQRDFSVHLPDKILQQMGSKGYAFSSASHHGEICGVVILLVLIVMTDYSNFR